MRLFEDTEMSESEMVIVKSAFSNPSVVKYIRGAAQRAATDFTTNYLAVTKEGELLDTVGAAIKGSFIQGMVAMAAEFLNIAEEPKAALVEVVTNPQSNQS